MDKLDTQLIALLQANSREATSSLARKLGVSRSTVQDRINKLEQRHIIQGFTIRFNPEHERHQITAHVMISVDPKLSDAVVRKLKQMLSLKALYAVSGQYDMIAVLIASTTQDMDASLDEIGRINGIERTTSSIVLSTKFER